MSRPVPPRVGIFALVGVILVASAGIGSTSGLIKGTSGDQPQAIKSALLTTGNQTTPPFVTDINRTYGGTNEDRANAVRQPNGGGYVIAGATNSSGSGGENAWVVKTDASGNSVWSRTYGGGAPDRAWAIEPTSDGGYVVAGTTESTANGTGDAWLIKINATGQQEWNRTYGIDKNVSWNSSVSGSMFDKGAAVKETPGGYVLAGRTSSYGDGAADAWLINVTNTGTERWNETYGGAEFDTAYDILRTSGGDYLIAGTDRSNGDDDAWLVKVDSTGNEQWNRTYGGAGSDEALTVQVAPGGGYVIGGKTTSFGKQSSDAWLVKVDSTGNEQWNRTYGGPGLDAIWSLRQTEGGNGYYLVGEDDGNGVIARVDSSGSKQWMASRGGTGNDWSLSAIRPSPKEVAMTGRLQSSTDGDAWLLVVDTQRTGVTVESDSGVVGKQVTVNVTSNASNVAGYAANVTFDPSVVTVKSVDASVDLTQSSAFNVNNQSGFVNIAAASDSGVDQPTLARITFEVKKAGTTDLRLVRNDTTLNDEDSQIPIDVYDDGSFTGLQPATFDINYSVDRTTVMRGNNVTVTATITNTGDVSGSTTVTFKSDGTEFDTRSLTLDSGQNATISSKTAFPTKGDHNVTVNDLTATSIRVMESVPLRLSANRTSIESGDAVRFTVTRNDTNRVATDANVTFDGAVYPLNASGQTTIRFVSTGTATVTASRSNTTYLTFENDTTSINVSNDSVALSIVANKTTIITGKTVQFTVTRADTGGKTGSTVTVAGTTLTASGGTVNYTFSSTGNFTATASKSDTATENFSNATETISVDQPATFDVSKHQFPTRVAQSENIRVQVNVTNVGDRDGTQKFTLTLGMNQLTTIEQRFDKGEQATLTFDTEVPRNQSPGPTTLVVNSSSGSNVSGSIQVIELGDANTDGNFQAIDAVVVLSEIVGLKTSIYRPAADLNQDGRISTLDATLILRKWAGLPISSGSQLSSPGFSTTAKNSDVWNPSIELPRTTSESGDKRKLVTVHGMALNNRLMNADDETNRGSTIQGAVDRHDDTTVSCIGSGTVGSFEPIASGEELNTEMWETCQGRIPPV